MFQTSIHDVPGSNLGGGDIGYIDRHVDLPWLIPG
jgi:hypothetical protein